MKERQRLREIGRRQVENMRRDAPKVAAAIRKIAKNHNMRVIDDILKDTSLDVDARKGWEKRLAVLSSEAS